MLISVIMTTHNCARYLELSIPSILRQTWRELELIVVDDCSDDNQETLSLLRRFRDQDARIRVVTMDQNRGTYTCKNVGLLLCRGEWIAFQDADDYSHRDRLKKQLAACYSSGTNASYCRFVNRRTREKNLVEISLMIRTQVMKQRLGFFHSVRFGADSELRNRLPRVGVPYVLVDEILYFCLDKWMETASNNTTGRQDSLTNSNRTGIRLAYATAFHAFHATVTEMNRLKYPFQNFPFSVPSLTPNDARTFYADSSPVRFGT